VLSRSTIRAEGITTRAGTRAARDCIRSTNSVQIASAISAFPGSTLVSDGTVNLASSTTQRQALLPLPVQGTVFNGTLTFTVRSPTGKGVQIDGLVVRRT
jgi:hypothetical protein